MNIISSLSLISVIVYLCIGIYVIAIDKKSTTHRLFFLICISLTIWAFFAIFAFSTKDKEIFLLYYKITSFGFLPFWALVLHFCLVISKVLKLRSYIAAILYLPAIAFIYRNLTAVLFYKDFILDGDLWIFITDTDSIWTYLYLLYTSVYTVGCVIFLILYIKRSATKREKKQSVTILSAFIICFIVGTTDAVLLPLVSSYKSPGPSPMIFLIWIFGIWYAIAKYRFLALTPELVSREIIANIDESIILFDPNIEIMFINEKTEKLIESSINKLNSKNLSAIIYEHEALLVEIKKLIEDNLQDFSTRLHYVKNEGENTLIDARLSIIKDRNGDIIGILLIGREVRGIKQLKAIYKFTIRQIEIIQHIISGISNKEIGDILNISERTVKGHITAIYNKLGVHNKMELMHTLKRYNIIPEKSSERIAILHKTE